MCGTSQNKSKKQKKKVVTKHTFVYSQNMKISKVKISKLNNNPEPLESPEPPQCNPPKARSRTSSNQPPDQITCWSVSQASMESRMANGSIMEQIGYDTFEAAILIHRSPWPTISRLNPLCFLWSTSSPWPQASPPFPLTLIDIILCKWGLPLCLAHQEHL